jgi:3' exoribonuclease, RNase T-like
MSREWWTHRVIRNLFQQTGKTSQQPGALDLMIDLETLSLDSNAYIRSIGACFFGPGDPVIYSTFYQCCDGPNQIGSHIDPDTQAWWSRQSVVAQSALINQAGVQLKPTLEDFSRWVWKFQEQESIRLLQLPMIVRPWGNGASFDIPIIENAMKRERVPIPWRFYDIRCFRTLKALYPNVVAEPFTGEKHNALDDAIHQAKHAARILQKISVR